MRTFIRRFGTVVLMLGFDPRRLYFSITGVYGYIRGLFKFFIQYIMSEQKNYLLKFVPILSDLNMPSGIAKGHYFHQDLWAARKIYSKSPSFHIDIGSRIDGFVSHILVFMNCTVLDVRPLDSDVPGLSFSQFDLMSDMPPMLRSESISCLHAIEHFGLGRYGDPIDINGWKKGFKNIAEMLTVGGNLYLSVPIGEQSIEFNAQRIFSVTTIYDEARLYSLALESFSFIDDTGKFHYDKSLRDAQNCKFGCGCYQFKKI